MYKEAEEWDLLFAIPNYPLKDVWECEKIAIVGIDDKRLKTIVKANKNLSKYTKGFKDQFKRKVKPHFVLIKASKDGGKHNVESIHSFRDIVSISCILKEYAIYIKHNRSWRVLYSDYFDLYPAIPTSDYKHILITSPALNSLDDINNFSGQSFPSIPASGPFSPSLDKNLFSMLNDAWSEYFIRGKSKTWKYMALFRSLNMAYKAMEVPKNKNPTIYDYGANVISWVSAFEILAHPKKGWTDINSVFSLFDKVNWLYRDNMKRRYPITHRRRKTYRSLPYSIYKKLYDLRNDFAHGNELKVKKFFPFGREFDSLLAYAPLLYHAALYGFLGNLSEDEINEKLESGEIDYADHLQLTYDRGMMESAMLSAASWSKYGKSKGNE